LVNAAFQTCDGDPRLPGNRFQLRQNPPADAKAPEPLCDEHALDLSVFALIHDCAAAG